MTPEIVVFDLGKVLVDFDYNILFKRLVPRSRLAVLNMAQFMKHLPLLNQLERGEISSRSFFDKIQEVFGYNGAFEEFALDFGDIFTEITEMTAFAAALRKHGVPIYIFSNTNDMAVDHIRNTFPFFTHFDGYIYSYQHKSMKPEAKLYEVVEQTSGRKGQSILYFDDREENIAAGAARGWQAWVHTTPAQSLAFAASLGLPVK